MRKRQKTALVLSGGGSRGAYELGVWQALREMDIRIDMVTGTSIGALNGCMIAMDDFENASKLWETITTSQLFEVEMPEKEDVELTQKTKEVLIAFAKSFFAKGGSGSGKIKELMESYIDEEKIRNSSVELGLVTVDVEDRKAKELFCKEIPEGKLLDFVLASAALFPAMKPYEIDGARYIDGGYYDNMPYRMAERRNAKRIIAVNLEAVGVYRGLETLKKRTGTVFIRSHWDLGPMMLFDRELIRRNQRLGYLDTMKAFDAFYGVRYTFVLGARERFLRLMLRPSRLADLLGLTGEFQPDGGLLGRMAKLRFGKFFEKYMGNEFPKVDEVVLVCAELAGSIFGLDPTKIYTRETFDERLSEEVEKVDAGFAVPLAGALSNSLEGLLGRFAPADQAVKTKRMALLLREADSGERETGTLTDTVIQTEEFFAAMYLVSGRIL